MESRNLAACLVGLEFTLGAAAYFFVGGSEKGRAFAITMLAWSVFEGALRYWCDSQEKTDDYKIHLAAQNKQKNTHIPWFPEDSAASANPASLARRVSFITP